MRPYRAEVAHQVDGRKHETCTCHKTADPDRHRSQAVGGEPIIAGSGRGVAGIGPWKPVEHVVEASRKQPLETKLWDTVNCV